MVKKAAEKAETHAPEGKKDTLASVNMGEGRVVDARPSPQTTEGYHELLHDFLDRVSPSLAEAMIANVKATESTWAKLKEERKHFKAGADGKLDDFAKGFNAALALVGSTAHVGMKMHSEAIQALIKELPLEHQRAAADGGFQTVLDFASLASAVMMTANEAYKFGESGHMSNRVELSLRLLDSAAHQFAMPLAELAVQSGTVPPGATIN